MKTPLSILIRFDFNRKKLLSMLCCSNQFLCRRGGHILIIKIIYELMEKELYNNFDIVSSKEFINSFV